MIGDEKLVYEILKDQGTGHPNGGWQRPQASKSSSPSLNYTERLPPGLACTCQVKKNRYEVKCEGDFRGGTLTLPLKHNNDAKGETTSGRPVVRAKGGTNDKPGEKEKNKKCALST